MYEPIRGPVAVLTGAGVSAESGVPTFRGQHLTASAPQSDRLATTPPGRSTPASPA
jgi:hypothetical protein